MEWAASSRSYDNCILAADIDMTGLDWTHKSFSGTFDGQGHTISNLTVSSESGAAGFFYSLQSDATVKGLTLTNARVTATEETFYGYAGGIAGYATGGSGIAACYSDADVTAYYYAGGIAGYSDGSGSITACYSAGEVTSLSNYAGGIAGYVRSSVTLTACYSTATVSGSTATGGVVGYMYGGDTTACYWSGSGPTSGVGYINSSSSSTYTDNTTKVDSDWSIAMTAMNEALEGGGYSYSYRINSGSDSESFPLVLE